MTKGSVDNGVVFHAGFPNAAEDEKFGNLSLDALIVKHRASTFFWRLETAVEELLWPAGTILVVDRALGPQEGNFVVVISDDDFLLCKYRKKGFVRLSGEVVNGSLWGVITYCIYLLQGATL